MSAIPNIQQITSKTSFLDTKTFEIEILTPVHVGSGREFSSDLDYITTSNHTKFYDLEKIFKDFGNDPKFLNAIEKGAISSFMDSHNNGKDYYNAEYEGKADAATIREFMMLANGKPVIPGSSIKGAIRTAFYTHYMQLANISNDRFENLITDYDKNTGTRKKKRNPSFVSNQLDEELMATQRGGKKPNYDFGRIVKVFDAEFSHDDLIVQNAKILNTTSMNDNKYEYAWKNIPQRFNGSYEKGTAVSFLGLKMDAISSPCKITLDTKAFSDINWSSSNRFNWTSFANILNLHAKKIINYEKAFIGKFEADDDIDAISVEIDNLIFELNHLDQKKISWIQQVGWGTGWHSKTGLSMNEDQSELARSYYNLVRRNVDVFPKTRKIVGDREGSYEDPTFQMGWIKITEVK